MFDSPLLEAWFHCMEQASVGKEPRVGAEDGPNPRNRQMRREKEPLVTSLATNTDA
jgi:hypothetical protein